MKIALIASQGGHLGQIHIIFTKKVLGKHGAVLITEHQDVEKQGAFKEKSFLGKYRTYYFKKDHLGFNPFAYLSTIITLRRIFKKENVKCLVTNGAQISIPAVIAGKLSGVKTIFIDTVIRVKTPNWSARASYFFSDIFLVQHLDMMKKYGKRARHEGGVL